METSNVKAAYHQNLDRELDDSAIELLKNLSHLRQQSGLKDGEITIKDYCIANSVTRGVADNELEKLVAKGFLVKRMAVHNGREVRAYREPD